MSDSSACLHPSTSQLSRSRFYTVHDEVVVCYLGQYSSQDHQMHMWELILASQFTLTAVLKVPCVCVCVCCLASTLERSPDQAHEPQIITWVCGPFSNRFVPFDGLSQRTKVSVLARLWECHFPAIPIWLVEFNVWNTVAALHLHHAKS